VNSVVPPAALAQGLALPAPGSMLAPSPEAVPVTMKGLRIHPDNPLLFDFILDSGRSGLKVTSRAFEAESQKLIRYFLASLTIPEKDLWVNLSPYEKDRMTAPEVASTELGRDMLAQDYVLKQLTASLVYPEKETGRRFWDRVYARVREKFGDEAVEIPVDTFNKVWIAADRARVFERDNAAYVVDGHLKVMIESDYLAASKSPVPAGEDSRSLAQKLAQGVLKEIVIPEIEKEVNEGAHFAPLRQMFHAMVLASWYKRALKGALLNQVYADQARTAGVLANDPRAAEKIYARYLEAFRRGVFNIIKEEAGPAGEVVPRKYFSGGLSLWAFMPAPAVTRDPAQARGIFTGDSAMVAVRMDRAMSAKSAARKVVSAEVMRLSLSSGRMDNGVDIPGVLSGNHGKFVEMDLTQPDRQAFDAWVQGGSAAKDWQASIPADRFFLLLRAGQPATVAALLRYRPSAEKGGVAYFYNTPSIPQNIGEVLEAGGIPSSDEDLPRGYRLGRPMFFRSGKASGERDRLLLYHRPEDTLPVFLKKDPVQGVIAQLSEAVASDEGIATLTQQVWDFLFTRMTYLRAPEFPINDEVRGFMTGILEGALGSYVELSGTPDGRAERMMRFISGITSGAVTGARSDGRTTRVDFLIRGGGESVSVGGVELDTAREYVVLAALKGFQYMLLDRNSRTDLEAVLPPKVTDVQNADAAQEVHSGKWLTLSVSEPLWERQRISSEATGNMASIIEIDPAPDDLAAFDRMVDFKGDQRSQTGDRFYFTHRQGVVQALFRVRPSTGPLLRTEVTLLADQEGYRAALDWLPEGLVAVDMDNMTLNFIKQSRLPVFYLGAWEGGRRNIVMFHSQAGEYKRYFDVQSWKHIRPSKVMERLRAALGRDSEIETLIRHVKNFMFETLDYDNMGHFSADDDSTDFVADLLSLSLELYAELLQRDEEQSRRVMDFIRGITAGTVVDASKDGGLLRVQYVLRDGRVERSRPWMNWDTSRERIVFDVLAFIGSAFMHGFGYADAAQKTPHPHPRHLLTLGLAARSLENAFYDPKTGVRIVALKGLSEAQRRAWYGFNGGGWEGKGALYMAFNSQGQLLFNAFEGTGDQGRFISAVKFSNALSIDAELEFFKQKMNVSTLNSPYTVAGLNRKDENQSPVVYFSDPDARGRQNAVVLAPVPKDSFESRLMGQTEVLGSVGMIGQKLRKAVSENGTIEGRKIGEVGVRGGEILQHLQAYGVVIPGDASGERNYTVAADLNEKEAVVRQVAGEDFDMVWGMLFSAWENRVDVVTKSVKAYLFSRIPAVDGRFQRLQPEERQLMGGILSEAIWLFARLRSNPRQAWMAASVWQFIEALNPSIMAVSVDSQAFVEEDAGRLRIDYVVASDGVKDTLSPMRWQDLEQLAAEDAFSHIEQEMMTGRPGNARRVPAVQSQYNLWSHPGSLLTLNIARSDFDFRVLPVGSGVKIIEFRQQGQNERWLWAGFNEQVDPWERSFIVLDAEDNLLFSAFVRSQDGTAVKAVDIVQFTEQPSEEAREIFLQNNLGTAVRNVTVKDLQTVDTRQGAVKVYFGDPGSDGKRSVVFLRDVLQAYYTGRFRAGQKAGPLTPANIMSVLDEAAYYNGSFPERDIERIGRRGTEILSRLRSEDIILMDRQGFRRVTMDLDVHEDVVREIAGDDFEAVWQVLTQARLTIIDRLAQDVRAYIFRSLPYREEGFGRESLQNREFISGVLSGAVRAYKNYILSGQTRMAARVLRFIQGLNVSVSRIYVKSGRGAPAADLSDVRIDYVLPARDGDGFTLKDVRWDAVKDVVAGQALERVRLGTMRGLEALVFPGRVSIRVDSVSYDTRKDAEEDDLFRPSNASLRELTGLRGNSQKSLDDLLGPGAVPESRYYLIEGEAGEAILLYRVDPGAERRPRAFTYIAFRSDSADEDVRTYLLPLVSSEEDAAPDGGLDTLTTVARAPYDGPAVLAQWSGVQESDNGLERELVLSWDREDADDAMSVTPGGIDLNAGRMSLDVQGNGSASAVITDQALAGEFVKDGLAGVEGVILRIVPLKDPLFGAGRMI
jgi:hypothetical protein